MAEAGTFCAIVPAAGSGRRFGGERSKQFAPVLGRPLLAWTVERLLTSPEIGRVIVAVPRGREDHTREMLERHAREVGRVPLTAVAGGRSRQESVHSALLAAGLGPADRVVVHDGARPCLAARDLEAVLRAGRRSDGVGAVLGRPVRDTLKVVSGGRLGRTVDRSGVFRAETPQAFWSRDLVAAFDRAAAENRQVSDESSLFPPGSVAVVPASRPNPKLTAPSDLPVIEALLRAERWAARPSPCAVGHGYDVHRLRPGRPLMLGGQHIPHDLGLDGHSDADVLLHAIGDALLGAAGLGDLGVHFPPSDDAWRGAASSDLVLQIMAMVRERGLAVCHCDATLIAERPAMAPWRTAIETHVAGLLGVVPRQVNFKATTHEGLGALGRGEGMAAHATLLLVRRTEAGASGWAPADTPAEVGR